MSMASPTVTAPEQRPAARLGRQGPQRAALVGLGARGAQDHPHRQVGDGEVPQAHTRQRSRGQGSGSTCSGLSPAPRHPRRDQSWLWWSLPAPCSTHARLPLFRCASPAATAWSSGGSGRDLLGVAGGQLLISASVPGVGSACVWLAWIWMRLACTSTALGTRICSTPSWTVASIASAMT
jgi:hypothetical protein